MSSLQADNSTKEFDGSLLYLERSQRSSFMLGDYTQTSYLPERKDYTSFVFKDPWYTGKYCPHSGY